MFIEKKHIHRRTFIRGMGVTLALPLLDAMVPARSLFAQTAAKGTSRIGFVYIPHGAIMSQWTPTAEGAGFEFTPILKPLEPFRERLNVITGLGHKAADTTAVHSLSPTTWLSGVRPKATQGVDAYAGVTADQIAAREIGRTSRIPSIEMSVDYPTQGSCDSGDCFYVNTVSWRNETTTNMAESHPRILFERLFGDGGSPACCTTSLMQGSRIVTSVPRPGPSLRMLTSP